jgi:hypothetical protein
MISNSELCALSLLIGILADPIISEKYILAVILQLH